MTWSAQLSAGPTSGGMDVRLVRGTTELSYARSTHDTTWDQGYGGVWLGSLSGSEALTIQARLQTTANSVDILAKNIKAVRLDDKLVADQDYYTTGSQEPNTDEVTNAATTGWTTVKTLTKTFHASSAQDYIVFGSMEISPDSSTNFCRAQMMVDGAAIGSYDQKGYATSDIYSYTLADVASIGSGSKSISLQGRSYGAATCDFMRSRIYVLRANLFDQVVEDTSAGNSTASTTEQTKNTLSYTPNQPEQVMVLGSANVSNSSGSRSSFYYKLYSGSTAFASGASLPGPGGAASDIPVLAAGVRTLSSATTYTTRYTDTNSVDVIHDARLIIWSMTLKQGGTTQANYRWFADSATTAPGAALAAQDTTAWRSPATPFRLRQRLAQSGAALNAGYGYKLQYAERSGTCDTGFSGETYSDIYTPPPGPVAAMPTASSQTTSGLSWANLANVYDADNLATAAVNVGGAAAFTRALRTSGFNFAIPTNATIDGISASFTTPNAAINDTGTSTDVFRLMKAGAEAGSDLATGTTFFTNSQTYTWGSSTQLWGTTWSPSDINNSGFGFSQMFQLNASGGIMQIDYVTITIYYSVPSSSGPIQYYTSSSVGDGSSISSSGSDPVNGARSTVYQTYRKTDPFAATSSVADGSDGLWDLHLTSTAAANGKYYCLRVVKDTGGLLDAYSYIPEIYINTTPGLSLDQQLRGGSSVIDGTKYNLVW